MRWVASSKREMQGMPDDVKDVFGRAILDVQYGDTPRGARPFGEGLPKEIMKLSEDYQGDTYRAVYTAEFADVVYVLDVFAKKSKSGIGTPKPDKERVVARFKAAAEHYKMSRGRSLEGIAMTTAKKNENIQVEESTGNVFADLGFADAEERLAKAELARVIHQVVESLGWTQCRAARALGLAAPDVSDLVRGRLARFSQGRLERCLLALDMDVTIRISRKKSKSPHARMKVELAPAV